MTDDLTIPAALEDRYEVTGIPGTGSHARVLRAEARVRRRPRWAPVAPAAA